MKPRKPIERRTPLRAKTQLAQASVSSGRGPVKPRKRPTVTGEERHARAAVRARSGGMCELAIPGICEGRATNYQHRVNRSQGGRYAPSAGLDACGSGTTGCHGAIHASPASAYRNGWSVKSTDDPLTVPVLYRGRWVLLDNQGGVAPATEKGEAA